MKIISCHKCGRRLNVREDRSVTALCPNCGRAVYISRSAWERIRSRFAAQAEPDSDKAGGCGLQFFGMAIVLFGGLLVFDSMSCKHEGLDAVTGPVPVDSPAVFIRVFEPFLGLGITFLGGKVARRGASLSAVPGWSVLESDGRPALLYFRSFKEDGADGIGRKKYLKITDALNYFMFGAMSTSAEEGMQLILRNYGPFVALGRPEERSQPVGAARVYLDSRTWKEGVKEMLALSSVAIFRAAASESLSWEMRTAVSILGLQRVLIILPLRTGARGESEYQGFRRFLECNVTCNLPNEIGGAYLMYFDKVGVAQLTGSDDLIPPVVLWQTLVKMGMKAKPKS